MAFRLFNARNFTNVALDAQEDTFFLFEPATGKPVHWNRTFSKISGYSDEEIAALPAPAAYYSEKDLKKAADFIKNIISKKGRGTIELNLICKNGQKIPFEYNVSSIKNEETGSEHLISIGRNISQRIQYETELKTKHKELETILNNSAETIYFYNFLTKSYEYLSPACEKVFGFTPEEITAMGLKKMLSKLHPDDIAGMEDQISMLYSGKAKDNFGQDLEYRFHHKTLGYRWIQDSRRLVYDDDNDKPIGIIGNALDITTKRNAQEKLRASETKYKNFIKHTGEGIYRVDLDPPVSFDLPDNEFVSAVNNNAVFKEVNPALAAMFKMPPEEMVGQPAASMAPDFGQRILTLKGNPERIKESMETKDIDADGHPVYLIESFYGETSKEGLIRIWGIQHDITRLKEVQEAYRIEKINYDSLFENLSDAIAIHEIVLDENNIPVDYIFRNANKAFETILDKSADEILNRRVTEVFPGIEQDSADWIGTYGRVVLTGESHTFESYSSVLDRWYSVIAYKTDFNKFATIFLDITDQKKTAQEAEKFKSISDQAGYGNAISDIDGHLIYINDYFSRKHGYTSAELTGKPLSIFHNGEQLPVVNKMIETLHQTGKFGPTEIWHTRKDGSVFPMLMSGLILKNANGSPEYMATTAIDISDLHETHQRLKESETIFSLFMDYLPAIVFIKDSDTKAIFVNDYFKKMLGEKEWVGNTVFDLFPEEIAQPMYDDDIRALEAGYQRVIETVPAADGNQYTYQTQKFAIPREGQKPLLGGIALNLTEERKAKEALEKSLNENKILLKELQHRAKNSFSMIMSMINLVIDKADENGKKMFEELQTKIKAISYMYDLIYQTNSVGEIRLDSYLSRLIATFTFHNKKLKLSENMEPATTTAKTAIPVGIITAELITNAQKHGFPEDRSGEINVSLTSSDHTAVLTIADNGTGPGEDSDPLSGNTLGLKIVRKLTEQIGGNFSIFYRTGTVCKLEFPLPIIKDPARDS